MMTSNRKLKELSKEVRRMIDGQDIDIRDNNEGILSLLKNDIYTLASMKSEQVDILQKERDNLADTLADISHQIKTPLTSMLLMLDLLESAPEEKQKEFIGNIRENLIHTEWLVSSLLKIAKLDAGAIQFRPSEIRVSELVRTAIQPLEILLDIKSQKVSVETDTTIVCDRRWTAEALTNIIKNASEYSPDGGIITVSAGQNPICSWIRITDSGSGIAAENIPKLFQRFEGSRSEKGFGVGLPLALAIMKRQNGDIEVDGGGKGTGAAFTLKFFSQVESDKSVT